MANLKKRILLAQFMRQLAAYSRKSNAYKRKWHNQANMIEAFGKYIGKPIYTNSFTSQIMEEYLYFLRSSKKNYAIGTVRDFTQKLGSAIRRADKRGFKVDFSFEEIQIKQEDSVSVYLSESEIEKIFNLKKISKEAHAVRERFVIACCTGMRISDIQSISIDNFRNGKVYRKTKKTGTPVIVPQHWMVKEILKRNKNKLPELHSQQAYNTMVKRLCKKAGITNKILIERTRGLKVERKLVQKYQLVSSHTARRSLATNMYLSGIPAARIMLITGHTTEQSFFKYIRINREENAETLAENPFFKGKK